MPLPLIAPPTQLGVPLSYDRRFLAQQMAPEVRVTVRERFGIVEIESGIEYRPQSRGREGVWTVTVPPEKFTVPVGLNWPAENVCVPAEDERPGAAQPQAAS